MDNADITKMQIATHHRVAVKPHFVSWIVVLGMVAAVTGCGWMKSHRTITVDQSDPYRLKSLPAIIASGDASTLVEPSDYSPTKSVKNTITDVLSILGNGELKQPGRSAERRQQVEQVIRRRVNFRQMAQRSLGSPWAKLSDREQQEFENLFVELIRDTSSVPTFSRYACVTE